MEGDKKGKPIYDTKEDSPDLSNQIRVKPIKNGTVIDHIPQGKALRVVHILGLEDTDSTVSILMNVKSAQFGKCKDVVKVENKELKKRELDRISLIAPGATINIIRDRNVAQKSKVSLPDMIFDIIKCPNPNCISNRDEPVVSEFVVESKEPLRLRCVYCERHANSESLTF